MFEVRKARRLIRTGGVVGEDHQLGADINAVARLTGQFRLRSGAISATYFDKYRFEADPKLLSRVAARMLLLPH